MSATKLSKWEWLQVVVSSLFFCLLCLGQLQRWQITPTVAVYGHDLVVIILLAMNAKWWLTEISGWKSAFSLQRDWLVVLLLGWAGVGWLLALVNGEPLLNAFFYVARLLAYVAVNWQLLHASWWPKLVPWLPTSERLISSYWLVGLFTMYCGFLQYWLLPDIRFMGTFGWDVHLYRLVSVQLDPNITGALLILTLFLTLSLTYLKPIVRWILALLVTYSIALTYSRSTFGAAVVGLLSWACIKRTQKNQVLTTFGLLVSLAVMIVFLPRPAGEGVRLERTASGVARVEASQGILSELSPVEWLLGRGLFVPGNFTQPSEVILGQHAQLADNILILFLTGLGVGGLLILIILLYRHRRALGQLSLLATVSMLAILAHSQFNNTLFQPFVWLMVTGIVLTSFKYQEKS